MVDRRKFMNSTQSSFIIDWDYPTKATKAERNSNGQPDQPE